VFPQPATFTLFTGLVGKKTWTAAVETAKEMCKGLSVRLVVVGPGSEYSDMLGEWAELREVEESGAVLARPDQMVAFRKGRVESGKEAEAGEELVQAFKKILGKKG
jgi:2,4-dichlorophenol 6-monooxygenase